MIFFQVYAYSHNFFPFQKIRWELKIFFRGELEIIFRTFVQKIWLFREIFPINFFFNIHLFMG